MALSQAPSGVPLKIVSIDGGQGVRQRLFSLGLHIEDVIELQSQAILRGPVLVRNLASNTSLALGRGVAQKIVVELPDER
ncbi:MAG: ferrous iron transport protein A [Candidatus Aminicenantes bacterium]|nr:ferrous iron transport protein A [Candidatus Aminicenantes bacterium]